MATEKALGFAQKLKAKADKEKAYEHKFYNYIPGDCAIALRKAMVFLGLDFEETATETSTPMGGTETVPFILHKGEDGTEVPVGTYIIKDVGEVQMRFQTYGSPAMVLTAYLIDATKRELWQSLIEKTQELAKTESAFLGKALRVDSPFDLLVPKLLPLDKNVDIALNDSVAEAVETALLWPLANRKLLIEHGLRGRRAAIFEGHYGTGKSLILYRAAQIAQASGMGVLHCKASILTTSIHIAKSLTPVLIVVEDIDASTHGNRDALNDMLNTISSVASKTTDDFFIAVSTNFIDRIDPALLRPERFDTVIHMDMPDVKTRERILSKYEGSNVIDMTYASLLTEGMTPAIICEIGQLSAINALRKGRRTTEAEFKDFVASMTRQKELATPDLRTDSVAVQLAANLYEATQGRIN